MEAKTIGKFIAVLRKANGMTQKELAEKLNVSDKAVSRWERDECLPDLSLIPVLAELFGVTADELLRGERIPAGEGEGKAPVKTRKQLERLLAAGRTKFRLRSVISVGLSIAGLLGALLLGEGFGYYQAGFYVGSLFYAAAVLCEVAFCILAFAAVSGDEFDADTLNTYRRGIAGTAKWVVPIPVILFGATLPEIVTWLPWLLCGLVGGVVAVVACMIAFWIAELAAVHRGLYTVPEQETRRKRLALRAVALTLCALAVTGLGQWTFNELVTYTTLAKGNRFQDYDAFTAYMETPMQNTGTNANGTAVLATEGPEGADGWMEVSEDVYYDGERYYNEVGDPISEEEALRRELITEDGEVVCSYIWRNWQAAQITCGAADTLLPITVYTFDDLEQGHTTKDAVNVAWLALYVVEVGAGVWYYWKKRTGAK